MFHDDIRSTVQRMTLEEKASLLSGQDFWHTQAIERLGIPPLMVSDGPHGLRKQASQGDHLGLAESVPATCFPSAVGLASTWDKELLEEVGHAIGREAKAQQVGVVLGPGVNLKRSPLCGRNFEYFSEDPLQAAEMAIPLIDGIQAEGIGTSLKHYAVNNQETDRMRIDAQVDERTLRELYLSVFERVITTSQPSTVMCSYNQVNGCFSSENQWLLSDVLREDWGFEGLVMTDWGAVRDRVQGVRAGLDLEMPSSNGLNDRNVMDAVAAGELEEAELDRAVERLLRLVARHHPAVREASSFDEDAHHELAARAAAQAAVLLKNDGSILPLEDLADVVVIGEMARTPRLQGAGSSQVNPTKVTSALEALLLRQDDLPFAPGYSLAGSPVSGADDDALREEAARVARGKTALVFIGLPAADESEGFDRSSISLPQTHVDLLRAVAATTSKVVVLLCNGAAVETASWQDEADAIIELWLGGQAGGEGASRLITGELAPSGRLAETISETLEQHPSQLNFPGEAGVVRYGEGLFIGYRGLDALKQNPSFPFGHGLTYTTFDFTNLTVDVRPAQECTESDPLLIAQFDVTNTGQRPGAAVPQLYVGYRDSQVCRPVRELRGFARVELDPGETQHMEISISRRELSFWDVRTHSWALEPGHITVEVGASAGDLPLRTEAELVAPPVLAPLHRSSTLSEWKQQPEAWRKIAVELGELGAKMDAAEEGEVMFAILKDMPAEKTALMFGTGLTYERLDELIVEFNRH